ncbi:MAG: DNA-binding protein [Chloroflexota bacterium]|nr:MAG: DNA-binding protein [Chloroflexota bacterium]
MVSETQIAWLTPAQAGTWLGVSAQRIRQLLDEGRLQGIRTPLGRLIDPESVETLARQRKEGDRA